VAQKLDEVDGLLRSRVTVGKAGAAGALGQLIGAGGKRIRPRLALLTGSLLGADPERLLPLAAAIELLHTATLIHDDLVDGAPLRRGRPTLNARHSPKVVVLAGDFAFAHAAQLAAETGSPAVMDMFARTLTTMAEGELIEASGEARIEGQEAYFRWIHAKTAVLFELASGAPALLSPADGPTVETMRRFGCHLGMAFQISDDILDFIGDPARVGKPVGSDLRQGVMTLPALYYFEAHPALRPAGERAEGPALERLIAAVRSNGAIARALQKAQDFVSSALGILAGFPPGAERAALAALAASIVQRES
jgi:geranylgeranyl pyrophosphate synthase